MAILYDVALILILAIIIFLGYKRGFIRTVVSLVGYVVSAVLAFLVSQPIANFIFDAFFRNSAIDMISAEVNKISAGQTVPQLLDTAIAAIPEKITALASGYVNIDEVKQTILASAPTAGDLSVTVVDQVIGPIATLVMQTAIFFVLFLVFCIVVKLITRALKIVDKLPVVGQANAVLGLLVGIVQAVVFLFLFTCVIALIVQLSGNQLEYINQDVIDKTYIFRLLYEINPLASV